MEEREREELIKNNTNLIYKAIKHTVKYWTFGNSFIDDLISIGYEALLRATSMFDDSKGCFEGFAYTCIRNDLIRYMSRMSKKSKEIEIRPLESILQDVEDDDDCLRFEDLLLNGGVDDSLNDGISRVYSEDVLNIIKSALIKKNEKWWMAVYLYGEGYRINDIAREIGVSRYTASRYIQRAKEYATNYLVKNNIIESVNDLLC